VRPDPESDVDPDGESNVDNPEGENGDETVVQATGAVSKKAHCASRRQKLLSNSLYPLR